MLTKCHLLAILVLGVGINSSFGATVYFANGAFTQNGIEWCEENEILYQSLGKDKFLEHHKHSIESRICVYLINDYFWNYHGENRVEKLIERSKYYSDLEIGDSQKEVNSEFSIKTDKLYYVNGDAIVVSGFIKNLNQDYAVLLILQVFDPTGNLARIDQVYPKTDGTYQTTFTATGTFKLGGQYSVQAAYSGQKATTTFEFAGGSGYTVPPPPPAASISKTKPNPPSSLVATAVSQNQINLSWKAPTNDGGGSIGGYKIEVREDNETFRVLASDTGKSTIYSHTGLKAGITYHYRVSAINSIGTSTPSAETSTKTHLQEKEQEPTKNVPDFDPKQGSQYYLDRYNNEPAFKEWFDTNYPDYTIEEALAIPGNFSKNLSKPILSFVDPEKDPYSYIDRYNKEPAYKEWFDTNFPGYTIEEAVGVTSSKSILSPPINNEQNQEIKPKLPEWVRNIFIWYAEERISENELLGAIQFLLDQGILKK